MLLSRNKTIFWDYIKDTKDKIKQLDIDMNKIELPDSLKQDLKQNCEKISSELTTMRMMLVEPELKSMEEWNSRKQNIAILGAKIADKIKQEIMANHAPAHTR